MGEQGISEVIPTAVAAWAAGIAEVQERIRPRFVRSEQRQRARRREWLRRRVDELKDVGGVLGMRATEELAAIPGVDKELNRVTECVQRTGETARPSGEAPQVMAQLGIAAFDGVRLAFVGQGRMLAGVVDEVGVGGQLVRIVLARGGGGVEQRLQALRLAVVGHVVGDDTARRPVYLRDEVDPLFFCPANV